MNLTKRIFTVLLMFSVLITASSCLGATSLEKYGYVLTIGIDKGKNYKYNISFLMENEAGDSEDETSKVNVVSADGDNIYEAIYIAEAGLPYRLNFSRVNYIVISYDIAANDKIMEIFSTSWAMLKVRTSSNMIVSNCTANEFMKGLNYTGEVNVTKLESSLIDFYETEGLTAMMSISEFMSGIESGRYDAVLPLGSTDNSVENDEQSNSDTTGGIDRSGGMVSYTLGAALFSGSRLCGTLSGRENQILLLMQGKLHGVSSQFTRADNTTYSIRLSNSDKPDVKINIVDDEIEVLYSLSLSVVLEQDSSEEMVDKMRKEGKLDESMKKQIKEYFESSCKTVFNECRNLNCDALGIGKYVCKEFLTVKDWENYGFRKHYQSTECDFKINIDLEDIHVSTYLE